MKSVSWVLLGALALLGCAGEPPLGPRVHRGDLPSPPLPPALLPPETSAAPLASPPPPSAAPLASAPSITELPYTRENPELGRAARQLAGLSREHDRAGARGILERHARATEQSFHAFEKRVGAAMSGWAKQKLLPLEQGTVLYPFGGPDLITAHRLYPGARRYVLVALQEGGAPPTLEGLSERELEQTLGLYQRVFDAFSRRGFFLTMHLGAGYQTPRAARGICGLLMAFAEREGLRVVDVEPVRWSKDGEVEEAPGQRSSQEQWSSLRMHLERREGGGRVLVDYLQIDLSDVALRRDEGARRLLERTSREAVILKAASHLPQQAGFSIVRGLLLEQATQILQDETGLPYRDLERGFDIRLFGAFRAVNGLFDGRPQRELGVAYATREGIEPLPFDLGYRKVAGSALMVATRPRPAVK
ncbi:MAG: hypothetical protein MUF64_09430 [Polyangiaceae bacterium]|nr:hypothetical protein [Polyangiaceae bacterium]